MSIHERHIGGVPVAEKDFVAFQFEIAMLRIERRYVVGGVRKQDADGWFFDQIQRKRHEFRSGVVRTEPFQTGVDDRDFRDDHAVCVEVPISVF